jgi:hypothetical protein
MSRSKGSSAARLDVARADHAAASSKLNELETARCAALLADQDSEAANLAVEIEQYRRLLRGFHDKIKLLEEEGEKEAQARREKERAALIERIEAKLEQRDEAMKEMAGAIKQLATASERAINLSREVIAAWSWHAHDLPAALLTPPSIMTAISHESYRLSYHPRRYGGMDTDPLAGSMLPGSRCPRLEWMELPERTRPMVDVVRDASEFAKRFLHTGKGSAAVEVVAAPLPAMNGGEGVQRSEAEQRLGALLKQMAELAEDISPQGEQEYARVVSEIAQVQSEITATKQMESQHGGV